MDQPNKLFAVHLVQANHWMALSSEAVADALRSGYTVATYTPALDTDESAIERAAVAMCEAGRVEWDVQEDHRKDHFRKLARTAIEAANGESQS